MAWYNPIAWFKANPAQARIASDSGSSVSTDQQITYLQAFEKLDVVNRGVNMLVSGAASLDYDIKEKVLDGVVGSVRQKQLEKLLNFRPNPYQDAQKFRTLIFTDFILEGNIFLYWDGVFLYHLPAAKVQIEPDPKAYVKYYLYNNETKFTPDEIIHVQDLSSSTIYRGSSRLEGALRSINILYDMERFQEQFFENGCMPGFVVETENTLSQVAKDRTIENWIRKYNPKNGAKKPIILDSGLKLKSIADVKFTDLDYDVSLVRHGEKILSALGVPPILINGGNNANISPNLRLFYLEAIIPIINKYISALERFFGYDIAAITSNVSALQPELKDIAQYHTTLVNGGIISPNEARTELRYAHIAGHDDLRIPANIAGSAVDPSQGGKPKQDGGNN